MLRFGLGGRLGGAAAPGLGDGDGRGQCQVKLGPKGAQAAEFGAGTPGLSLGSRGPIRFRRIEDWGWGAALSPPLPPGDKSGAGIGNRPGGASAPLRENWRPGPVLTCLPVT